MGDAVTYLETLQFSRKPNITHLVRGTHWGTPGPTLCGRDRFWRPNHGWSVGGAVTSLGMTHTPCSGCVDTARGDFPGLPVVGMAALATPVAEALGVARFGFAHEIPRATPGGTE